MARVKQIIGWTAIVLFAATLAGIWVLTAVTVGGGLFGLLGVLLSVPVASVLYALLRRDVHKRLACKE